jgi:hypothetical protein
MPYMKTTLIAAVALSGASAAADQHSGTWRMKPAKSNYSPGPAAKSVALEVESNENGIKIDADGTDGDGNPTHAQYDAKFDGKDYPATGLPNGDTVSVKRIGANTIRATIKNGDQVVMTVTSKVSTEGKTKTSIFKGKDAQGRDVNNVVVYDRQ